MHSALTTKRGPAPPPVRSVAAALDDGGSTQGGELLDSDCEPLTDRRTALNVGEDAAVQPNAVTQACSPSRLTIGSDVRTERHSTPLPQVLKLLKISSHGNALPLNSAHHFDGGIMVKTTDLISVLTQMDIK